MPVARWFHEHVEVPDERLPFAVERGADIFRHRRKLTGKLAAHAEPRTTPTGLRGAGRLRSARALPPPVAAFVALLRRGWLIFQTVHGVATGALRKKPLGIRFCFGSCGASSAPGGGLRNGSVFPALVRSQVARIEDAARAEPNRLTAIGENQRSRCRPFAAGTPRAAPPARHRCKGQLQRLVLVSGYRRYRSRQFVVIERRPFRSRAGIPQHELGASPDRSRKPEPIGIADPGDRAGRVHHQVAGLLLQSLCPPIIRQRSLALQSIYRGERAENRGYTTNFESHLIS